MWIMRKKYLSNLFFPLLLAGLIAGAAGVAGAAGPVEPGTLLQEQRQATPPLPDRLPAEREGEESVRPPLTDSGVKILVKGFRFIGGEEVATEEELQILVRDLVGRELGFAELQQAASRVTNYLREKKGFSLARAYLPRQDVTGGIIEIVIVSGRIDGKARIRIQEPHRIRASVLSGIAERALPEGRPARMEDIERGVLLLNDLPGINARAYLEPADKPGTTRAVIRADEGPLFHASAAADNYGDPYTGIWRGTGQVAAFDPLGFGDQFTLSLTAAERMHFGRAGWSIPIGSTGLTGNLSYTSMFYEVGEEFSQPDIKGRADTLSAGLGYPLLRSRRATIRADLGFEYLLLRGEALGSDTMDRRVATGNFALSGNFYDSFGGGGLTNASITVTQGNTDLSRNPDDESQDESGPRTSGDFFKAAYSVSRLQRLTPLVSLYGSVRGQFASGNLESSQMFILGGPTGVRAYPTGEAPGSEGHLFTGEARVDLPFMPAWAATQLVGFFDAGWIRLYRDTWPGAITNATGKNEYGLSGAGLGVNIGKAGLYSLRACYAHKIGENDGRSESGMDADNRSDSGRFWVLFMILI